MIADRTNGEAGTPVDRKGRWGGLLENPWVSMVQRALLDFGRVAGLSRALKPYCHLSMLDVGCGLAECSRIARGAYTGVDNSPPRVAFAARRYPRHHFLVADAWQLPFPNRSFDMALMIDTSHHLTDAQWRTTMQEMRRVSLKHLVVSDPVPYAGQGWLSRLFYRLDRGANFRSVSQMQAFFAGLEGVRLRETRTFRTFPGLYVHATFLLDV